MISAVRGEITRRSAGVVEVQMGPIAVRVTVPEPIVCRLEVGEDVRLLTHLDVKENSLTLYGFESREQKDLFVRLLDVQRVGPKVAMGVLSSCGVDEFAEMVRKGNVAALANRVSGVGRKTAQRLVLELKGELVSTDSGSRRMSEAGRNAIKALRELGVQPKNAKQAVRLAIDTLSEDATEEEIVAASLT